jgi:hypothetical protein
LSCPALQASQAALATVKMQVRNRYISSASRSARELLDGQRYFRNWISPIAWGVSGARTAPIEFTDRHVIPDWEGRVCRFHSRVCTAGNHRAVHTAATSPKASCCRANHTPD